MDLREATQKVIDGKGLSCQEMESAMSLILEGKATSSQMAAFLVALRCKGESVEEITGAVTVMRQRMVSFKPVREGVLDTCGTG
ncbi:MAG: anthranilate phosphoribosyltransferase, partial [Candidatus Omnitrophica bacterium]|nr:anthranilate phosphoribosyltransferase [Candidatus Omnitrophota bacterium]